MNCHSQIWADSPYLAPVRESWKNKTPIEWTRVHDLPDYAYFNHSIHVAKGVGCASCHGQVDEMPLMYQASSLQMEWCLSCHREPEKFIRPKDKIYDMKWRLQNKTEQELAEGRRLKEEYHILDDKTLTSCSTCHR
jgi:hypothetical protein